MKTSSNFVLRRVAGECMLMPAGDNISTFRGVLLMNELSAFVIVSKPKEKDSLPFAIALRPPATESFPLAVFEFIIKHIS